MMCLKTLAIVGIQSVSAIRMSALILATPRSKNGVMDGECTPLDLRPYIAPNFGLLVVQANAQRGLQVRIKKHVKLVIKLAIE
jgi:hypothetical protein